MVAKNAYATLKDYKDYAYIDTPDEYDDEVINRMLEQSCRTIEGESGRVVYPQVKTLYFDLPNERQLDMKYHDLLEVLTLTNGNGDVISSSEYNLLPYNLYPKYGLELTDISSEQWYTSTGGSSRKVVSLKGIFGFNKDYDNAWLNAGTLGSAMGDTTTKDYTLNSGHAVETGNVIRIDDELMVVESVSDTTVTVVDRAGNGSTAANHNISSVVKVWQFQAEFVLACKETTSMLYKLRTGAIDQGEVTVTPSGQVKVSGGIPKYTRELIASVRRRT